MLLWNNISVVRKMNGVLLRVKGVKENAENDINRRR